MFESLASSSAGNAYLVRRGGSTLGIEAGIPWRAYQRALDFKTSQLDAVVLGHEHGDHARCAQDLMRAGVDVYATRGTLDALGITGHRAHALPMKAEVKVGDWRILAFPAIHDAAEPCGFLIGHGDYRLAYLSDSAYSPFRFDGLVEIALEANFSMKALLASVERGGVEALHASRIIKSHLSIERAVEILEANDLSRCKVIWLLHMSNSNSDAAAFKAAVEAATGIPVRVAEERGVTA